MYAKRIQIVNCGAIEHVDITFPFNGENPKPILLVGENGSGKSILLSHIVNLLMAAQGAVYSKNSEVEKGAVYKLRSSLYVRSGSEYYWGQVDFEEELYCKELFLSRPKKDFLQKPADINVQLWNSIAGEEMSCHGTNLNGTSKQNVIKNLFKENCILYFPSNRFEDPAWLNEENLRAKVKYMTLKHFEGYTDRKIINYSPLRDNQNWVFGILYDSRVFEILIGHRHDESTHSDLKIFEGYKGKATSIFNTVLAVTQQIFRVDGDLRFGIGIRQRRTISLMQGNQILVPNIFQLSSGETSLLNLFLSILRDFDLSSASFTKAEDVRGIVVVDEIDLHLHAIHQYEVLPKLVKMFPRVQFIVTTHSPLFVLGMEKTFGQDGFGLYKMPQGQQIDPEEFSEFDNAYQFFIATNKRQDDIKKVIEGTQKPIVFVEGKTDIKYLEKAAELLNEKEIIKKIQIKYAGGSGNLKNIRKSLNSKLVKVISQKIILLYDCDEQKCENKGQIFVRSIPIQESHPLKKGIENLFDKEALNKARESKPELIDIEEKHKNKKRGKDENIPEKWSVDENEKSNLCDWFCKNGTEKDFKHFQVIFDLLQEIIFDNQAVVAPESINQPVQPK